MNLPGQILPQWTDGGRLQVEPPVKTNDGEQVNRKSGDFLFRLLNLGCGQVKNFSLLILFMHQIDMFII